MTQCCFCGKELEIKDQHDPRPLRKNENCCIDCNSQYVIPIRMIVWRLDLDMQKDVEKHLLTMSVETLDDLLTRDEKEREQKILKELEELVERDV